MEGERRVSLTTEVKQNVLGEQLAALTIYPLQISQLQNAFLWQYGYGLKPSMYECETLMELLQKLDDAVKVSPTLKWLVLPVQCVYFVYL